MTASNTSSVLYICLMSWDFVSVDNFLFIILTYLTSPYSSPQAFSFWVYLMPNLRESNTARWLNTLQSQLSNVLLPFSLRCANSSWCWWNCVDPLKPCNWYFLNTHHNLVASKKITDSFPITEALCTTPAGTTTMSPGCKITSLPNMANLNWPEIIESFLETLWVWSGKSVPGGKVYLEQE